MHKVHIQWHGKWITCLAGNCRIRLINRLYKKASNSYYHNFKKFKMWNDI